MSRRSTGTMTRQGLRLCAISDGRVLNRLGNVMSANAVNTVRGTRKKVLLMELNLYDQCEIIEGCTVEILTNTLTGETSVGWWRGGVEDRPGMECDD